MPNFLLILKLIIKFFVKILSIAGKRLFNLIEVENFEQF
jgi:hypothetical protein